VSQPLSTTSNAILGLLSLRSWTTYELAKQAQKSLAWFWPRAERKLYEEPKRLVAAGYAKAANEMTGARPRTVYNVTARGRKALATWLDEPPAPPSLEFEGMVKVFFADGGTLAQLRTTLTRIAEQSDERLADIASRFPENATADAPFPDRLAINTLGLRFVADHERAIGSWARWALEQTTGWRSPTDPGRWDPRMAFEERV
jgi:DNA-binding PadR family transcriptional regulator